MSPHERAVEARHVLNNSVFKEALKELESSLVSSWKSSSPEQWKFRERVYDQLQALQDVKQKLETFIATAALDSTATR